MNRMNDQRFSLASILDCYSVAFSLLSSDYAALSMESWEIHTTLVSRFCLKDNTLVILKFLKVLRQANLSLGRGGLTELGTGLSSKTTDSLCHELQKLHLI